MNQLQKYGSRELRTDKALIRDFLKSHYSDTNLAEALDLARAGRLFFESCCCLVRIPTRNHGDFPSNATEWVRVHQPADGFPSSGNHLAADAENAFLRLYHYASYGWINQDNARCRLIVPILKAEIRRRIAVRPLVESVGVEASIDQELTKAQ